MKQKLLFILALTIATALNVSAQTPGKIAGEIKDKTGKGIGAATIMLMRAKDSGLVKTEVSNNNGGYEFRQVKPGNFFIRVTAINMKPAATGMITVADGQSVTAPGVALSPADKALQAVTVTSKKPMIEVRADKTIVNVEGTINAVGNDGLELLRKSPGVMIDKDDNISLAGKTGVKIYIDGKPSPLSGTDLSAYLKSMQSSQIESIEIITNPSAKYEAEGNAGIINIKLKKNLAIGTNGSVNAGYNIGIYPKSNFGINLNHRDLKSNTFGSYNFNENLNEFNISLYRTTFDTIFDQHNRILNKNKGSHNFKTGVDFFLNKVSTVGFVVNGNISDNQTLTEGPMPITYAPTGTLVKTLYATGDNKTKRTNINFNGNYRYAVTGGSELNLDADYGFYKLRTDQVQPNDYYDPNGNKLYSNVYHMISPTDITIASFKGDYEQNFKKGRLGYGGKIGFVKTDNDFGRYNVYPTNEIYDTARSNRFQYKENVNAAYVNYNTALKTGWVLQAGVRMEQTNAKGESTGFKWDDLAKVYNVYDSLIKRNYVDFFPSFAVTYNKNPLNQWGISYSRRIDRPAYQDLNPFEFKLNDYSYMKGNTQLRPQYTNSFSLTNTYKYKLNTRLNYSHVKDIFSMLPDTTEKSKAFVTKKNLAKQDIVSLNISYPFQWKWYSFFVNLNTYYSHFQSKEFGTGDRNVNLDVYSVSFFMQNTFKLGKGYTAELSGFYNSPSIWQGAFKSRSIYNIDGGVQKTILKGKGTVKASVSDMFNLLKFHGESNFTGQTSVFNGKPESRQFKISANIRFGRQQIKQTRQRKSAIEDENNRTNSSGGIGGQ
ncbi:MAG TPA: TonB-dependent receptor [Ferruginibacter sp.]|nr:TonB-dependent receptor [Ferruginibacter sp.]